MQIVIEIPDEDIPQKQDVIELNLYCMGGKVYQVGHYNFSVLSKGHGRLIDSASTILENDGNTDANSN